jgi:oligopeptidase B
MNKYALVLAVACGSALGAQNPEVTQQAASLSAPRARRETHVTVVHGDTLRDDYFWLRNRDAEVVKHLEAENAYTSAVMKPTEKLQQQLYDEMLGRIKQTDESAPYRKGNYLYSARTEEGKQYSINVRRKIGGTAEEVLLDQNALAKGRGFFALGAFAVSDDGNYLAYSVDTTGYRQYTLRVKDLRTGNLLADNTPRVGAIVWAADDKTLFLTTEDSITKRSDKFWRHTVNTTTSTQLFEEKDELFDVWASRSADRTVIVLESDAKKSSEAWYLPADQPTAPLKLVLPREPNHQFSVTADGGRFYIRTDKDAMNFRLVSAPMTDPSSAHWTDVIAHDPNVALNDVNFFANHIVATERENGLAYLRVIDKKTGSSHRIETPEPAYAISMGNNFEYNAPSIQFNYNSLVSPNSTFDYGLDTHQRTLVKQQPVIGYDPAKYESKRIWATARDGVKIPVAIVYKKGTPLDGSAPMHLYAYGSYGINIDATFNSSRVSLLDRGFIYALASIRGGGELGEPWRNAGRMMQKMNTFTDFIDVADYLEKNKYTSADRLMISGASAGGLLMGAVVNMAPDRFKAAIAAVPFVDVINTMLDASLPLTTSEYVEWGNPNVKSEFDYIMKYSPYDNVKAQRYPAMLVEVSYNDSQVPYWEGTKFAAKIRSMKTDTNLLLLKANMGAGHGGASGRYDRLHEVALEYAFLISQAP